MCIFSLRKIKWKIFDVLTCHSRSVHIYTHKYVCQCPLTIQNWLREMTLHIWHMQIVWSFPFCYTFACDSKPNRTGHISCACNAFSRPLGSLKMITVRLGDDTRRPKVESEVKALHLKVIHLLIINIYLHLIKLLARKQNFRMNE